MRGVKAGNNAKAYKPVSDKKWELKVIVDGGRKDFAAKHTPPTSSKKGRRELRKKGSGGSKTT